MILHAGVHSSPAGVGRTAEPNRQTALTRVWSLGWNLGSIREHHAFIAPTVPEV
jgi:hypothetical protein